MDDLTATPPDPANDIIIVSAPDDTWRPYRKLPPAPVLPPQFGLRDMMIATGMIATFFGFARLIHVFALLIAFIVFAICRLVDLTSGRRPGPTKQWVYDVMTGVLLPIGCLVYDPMFFHSHGPRVIGFAIFGSQMLLMFCWLMLATRLSPNAHGFFAGFLMFGAMVAALIGLLLTPFTMIGIFVLIGALGVVPYLTAMTYFRHARTAWQQAGVGSDRAIAAATGFVAAIAVGIVAFSFKGYIPVEWLGPTAEMPFIWSD